jgi:hypothetical protein
MLDPEIYLESATVPVPPYEATITDEDAHSSRPLSPRYHIRANQFAACGSGRLDGTEGLLADGIAKSNRCRLPGCKERWPK